MIDNPEPVPPTMPAHPTAIGVIMVRIGKFAVSRLPKSWGFAIFAFPFDGTSGLRFVSNGSTGDVVELLRKFVEHYDTRNDN